MMKSSLICALGILALIAAGSLVAQTQDLYVSGTVVSSSSTTLVITTEAGDQMTFGVDSQSALPSPLEAGAHVDVRYHAAEGGGYLAAEVRTVGSTAEPATTTGQAGAEPAPESGSERLPQTASPLVLVGLIGLGSLGAAAGLKAFIR